MESCKIELCDVLARAATYRVNALVRAGRLARQEAEDAHQTLVEHQLRQLARHDPRRARLTTYAALVARTRAARLVDHRTAQCRCPTAEAFSLNQPGDNDQLPDVAAPGNATDADLARRMDVARVVATLPPTQQRLCELLAGGTTVAEAARLLDINRSWAYDLIGRIRAAFEASNVRPDSLRVSGQ